MEKNLMRPYEGEEPYIFIDCSHIDFKTVNPIIKGMCDQGYRIWWGEGIQLGDPWASIIADRISRCAVFMCFISKTSLKSINVLNELEYGRRQGRNLLIVLLDNMDFPVELKLHFGRHQILRYKDFAGIEDFLEQLNRTLTLEITRTIPGSKPEKRTEKRTLRECKVIFLGDADAGKSSLIERMVNHRFQANSLPTDGVKMTKWETSLDGKPFVLRILDFGGQEILHSMHRCFLTSHTVYVVVCESRDDTEIDSVAARWLETVKAFAPDCPVILALNKADLNANVSVNRKELERRNPRLAAVLRTSAAVEAEEPYGVAGLIDAIWKEIPACINRFEADASKLDIKQELENIKEHYITAEAYQQICKNHDILQSEVQRSLLDWFKDLGVAYYYEPKKLDILVDSVRVLNPAWLTNGISRLILRAPENGFLTHDTIKETLYATNEKDVLPDVSYKPEETEYILHVMEIFEISHDMGNGVEMIPVKMPKTPPDKADRFPKEQALHLRWKGAYLPNNVIHRLMIRKFSELDTSCVWRTGGRFEKADSQCTALAEMNENTLDVYVTGEKGAQKYYMESFRDEIRMILVGLHISAEEIICYRVNGKEGEIPYTGAMDALERGIKQIPIYDINEYVSPRELIGAMYPEITTELQRYLAFRKSEESNGSKAEDFDHITAGTERIVNMILKIIAIIISVLVLTGGILSIADPALKDAIIEYLKAFF